MLESLYIDLEGLGLEAEVRKINDALVNFSLRNMEPHYAQHQMGSFFFATLKKCYERRIKSISYEVLVPTHFDDLAISAFHSKYQEKGWMIYSSRIYQQSNVPKYLTLVMVKFG